MGVNICYISAVFGFCYGRGLRSIVRSVSMKMASWPLTPERYRNIYSLRNVPTSSSNMMDLDAFYVHLPSVTSTLHDDVAIEMLSAACSCLGYPSATSISYELTAQVELVRYSLLHLSISVATELIPSALSSCFPSLASEILDVAHHHICG